MFERKTVVSIDGVSPKNPITLNGVTGFAGVVTIGGYDFAALPSTMKFPTAKSEQSKPGALEHSSGMTTVAIYNLAKEDVATLEAKKGVFHVKAATVETQNGEDLMIGDLDGKFVLYGTLAVNTARNIASTDAKATVSNASLSLMSPDQETTTVRDSELKASFVRS